jgi:hypothetical protein
MRRILSQISYFRSSPLPRPLYNCPIPPSRRPSSRPMQSASRLNPHRPPDCSPLMLDHSPFLDYPRESFPPESPVFDSEQLLFGPLDMDDGRRHDSTTSPSHGMRPAPSQPLPSLPTLSPLPPHHPPVYSTSAPPLHPATSVSRLDPSPVFLTSIPPLASTMIAICMPTGSLMIYPPRHLLPFPLSSLPHYRTLSPSHPRLPSFHLVVIMVH